MAVERKKFFDVEVPAMGTTLSLYGKSIKDFDQRIVKVDLTRSLRGKSLEASLIVKVEGNKATAEPKRMLLLPSFMRRMIRDSMSYVEDSFSAECLDASLRVKIFLITRKKVPRSVRKALREAAQKYLKEDLKEKTREEIVADMINNKIQRPLSLKLKKIYPLSLCEIRELKVEKVIPGFVRPKREITQEERSEVQAETSEKHVIAEGLDQMKEAEAEVSKPMIEEGLDQMKEIEAHLAKRAEEAKTQALQEDTTSDTPKKQETEEKPKKRGRKKKEDSEKKPENSNSEKKEE